MLPVGPAKCRRVRDRQSSYRGARCFVALQPEIAAPASWHVELGAEGPQCWTIPLGRNFLAAKEAFEEAEVKDAIMQLVCDLLCHAYIRSHNLHLHKCLQQKADFFRVDGLD